MAADGATAAAAAAAAAMAAGVEAGLGGGGGSEERAAKRARVEGEQGGPTSSTDDEGRGGDKSKAPMSSSEARGTLFGALGGDGKGDMQQAAMLQQAQQLQQQLMYATQPGMMLPGLAGLMPGGFAVGEGAPQGDGGAAGGQAPQEGQ